MSTPPLGAELQRLSSSSHQHTANREIHDKRSNQCRAAAMHTDRSSLQMTVPVQFSMSNGPGRTSSPLTQHLIHQSSNVRMNGSSLLTSKSDESLVAEFTWSQRDRRSATQLYDCYLAFQTESNGRFKRHDHSLSGTCGELAAPVSSVVSQAAAKSFPDFLVDFLYRSTSTEIWSPESPHEGFPRVSVTEALPPIPGDVEVADAKSVPSMVTAAPSPEPDFEDSSRCDPRCPVPVNGEISTSLDDHKTVSDGTASDSDGCDTSSTNDHTSDQEGLLPDHSNYDQNLLRALVRCWTLVESRYAESDRQQAVEDFLRRELNLDFDGLRRVVGEKG
jgi:hypothetical protein